MPESRCTIHEFVARMKARWIGSPAALSELDVMRAEFCEGRTDATVQSARLSDTEWLVHATISRWRKEDD